MATMTVTYEPNSYRKVLWEGVATGGTIPAFMVPQREGEVGSLTAFGTWGSATVTLEGSNDGTNWVELADDSGTTAELTDDGALEFQTAMLYLRPGISGGTSDDIDVTMILRG